MASTATPGSGKHKARRTAPSSAEPRPGAGALPVKAAKSPESSKPSSSSKPLKPSTPPKAFRVAAGAGDQHAASARLPTAAPAGAPASAKPRKPVLVRDSFTMPEVDFELIGALKKRAIAFQRPAKKSELLRAGLHALNSLDDARLKAVLDGLVEVKSGRPKKH